MALAAGVTFYLILALFPAIAALVALYGLFADPTTIAAHLDSLSGILPEGALSLLVGSAGIASLSTRTGRPTWAWTEVRQRAWDGIHFAVGIAAQSAYTDADKAILARVAGLDKETGSLETGKRADLIALRLDRPHAVPLYNVYSQIVYALKGYDVQDVMVNGKPIVRDGRSLTLDAAVVLAKAREYADKVKASLK